MSIERHLRPAVFAAIALACVALACVALPALASPWAEVGDNQLRSDIELLASAGMVIVSDPVPEWRELALRLGATHAIDPTTDDVTSACLDLTEHGVDFAFDAVGRNALIETGINATRFGGSTVLVGVAPLGDPLHYPSATIVAAMAKNILGCLLGSANSLREIPRLVDLWRGGQLDLESLITGHRPLDDINAAVDDLRASRGVRTVIDL